MIDSEDRAAMRMALSDVKHEMETMSMGRPPGAKPMPWKEQCAAFLAVLPDLMMGGPQAQAIDAEQGAGAAQEYLTTMLQQIAQGRQRRRPM